MLSTLIPEAWREVLQDHLKDIDEIGSELQRRADTGKRILPDKKWVFRALELHQGLLLGAHVGHDRRSSKGTRAERADSSETRSGHQRPPVPRL